MSNQTKQKKVELTIDMMVTKLLMAVNGRLELSEVMEGLANIVIATHSDLLESEGHDVDEQTVIADLADRMVEASSALRTFASTGAAQ